MNNSNNLLEQREYSQETLINVDMFAYKLEQSRANSSDGLPFYKQQFVLYDDWNKKIEVNLDSYYNGGNGIWAKKIKEYEQNMKDIDKARENDDPDAIARCDRRFLEIDRELATEIILSEIQKDNTNTLAAQFTTQGLKGNPKTVEEARSDLLQTFNSLKNDDLMQGVKTMELKDKADITHYVLKKEAEEEEPKKPDNVEDISEEIETINLTGAIFVWGDPEFKKENELDKEAKKVFETLKEKAELFVDKGQDTEVLIVGRYWNDWTTSANDTRRDRAERVKAEFLRFVLEKLAGEEKDVFDEYNTKIKISDIEQKYLDSLGEEDKQKYQKIKNNIVLAYCTKGNKSITMDMLPKNKALKDKGKNRYNFNLFEEKERVAELKSFNEWEENTISEENITNTISQHFGDITDSFVDDDAKKEAAKGYYMLSELYPHTLEQRLQNMQQRIKYHFAQSTNNVALDPKTEQIIKASMSFVFVDYIDNVKDNKDNLNMNNPDPMRDRMLRQQIMDHILGQEIYKTYQNDQSNISLSDEAKKLAQKEQSEIKNDDFVRLGELVRAANIADDTNS